MNDVAFMKRALEEARAAALAGEVPVGAVVVRDGEIISAGRNTVEAEKNLTGHAEINAIKKACERLGSIRLEECILYTTLEPCAMCAGAIIHARIDKVVFGVFDEKFGAAGSVCNLFAMKFNHCVETKSGVMAEESAVLLKEFFKKLR